MTVSLIRGNARTLPLADNTVDLVVSSPPYWSLRSYQDGGVHYEQQIGSEPTPAEFVDALIEVTRECVRVLKPSGSLWVNLGDKYAGGIPGGHKGGNIQASKYADHEGQFRTSTANLGIRPKSLIGIPWRYALRCIDDLGLILRAEVIWSKPNGLPESVTDRVRRSHEQWFHFTLEPRYYSAVDEIREPHSPNGHARRADGQPTPKQGAGLDLDVRRGYMAETYTNPLGKLPGSVWTIPTEPLIVPPELGVDHFAAFPTEWPRRIIQGWSPAGVCVECGEGRRPVASNRITATRGGRQFNPSSGNIGVLGAEREYTITGYACACTPTRIERVPTRYSPDDFNDPGAWEPYDEVTVIDWAAWTPAPTTPGVVLDPFGGTGTTALVADALGRHGISVDMSADYCRLARWRTTDPGQRAKAARVEKPPAEVEGQLGFDFDVETVPSKRMSGGLAMANAKGRNCLGCGYRTQRPSGCEKCGGVDMEGIA